MSLFMSSGALAMSPYDQMQSESVAPFRKVKAVQAPTIVVPTVVELPLNIGTEERNDLAILDTTTNTYVPYYVRSSYLTYPEIVTAYTDSANGYPLVDGDTQTHVEFFVQEETQNSARITLTTVNPIESSSIVLELDQYVALPTRVSVSASIDGVNEQIVVAPKSLTESTITFPRTTANTWILTLEYAQPLRINELRLVQDAAERTLKRSVRFLAQPQSMYNVFHDSDRAISIHTPESGNLMDNTGVLLLPVAPSMNNDLYRQADIDGDSIPDTRDNCVQMSNVDQADIDRNGRGDMCDDFDRDGVMQSSDNCPNNPNVSQEDADSDGIGDACDTEENRITEKYPWVPWAGMGIAVLVLGVLFVLVGTSPKNTQDQVLG
jgi:hypothetical protein